jgi:hypothetical protein
MGRGTLWRHRWRLLRWSLFVGALAALTVGLYVMLPAEPRWVLAGSQMSAFYVAPGRIATYASPGNTATGPLKLWDAATGSNLDRFLEGEEPFKAYAHAEDGRRFVAFIKAREPGVWRIRGVDLQARREWQAETRVAAFDSPLFSPHCDFVALHVKQNDDSEASYVVVDTSSGCIVATLHGEPEEIVFSANAGCLAAGYRDEEDAHYLRVLNTQTGKITVIDDARFLAVSPDGRWIVGDRGEEGVWLWDVERSHWHVALADAKARAAGRINVNNDLWLDLGMTRLAGVFYRHRQRTFYRLSAVRLITDGDRSLRYFLSDRHEVSFVHDSQCFAPDSQSLLWNASVALEPRRWVLYDVHTGKPRWKRELEQGGAVPPFTPDSRQIVTLGREPAVVEVVDAAIGETLQRLPLTGLESPSLRIARDGRTLVVTSLPSEEEPHWLIAKVEQWLAPPRSAPAMLIRTFDLETGATLCESCVEEADEYWLTEDARTLVTVTSENGDDGVVSTTICGWDMPAVKPLRWVLGAPLVVGLCLLALPVGWRWLRRWNRVRTGQRPPTAGTA